MAQLSPHPEDVNKDNTSGNLLNDIQDDGDSPQQTDRFGDKYVNAEHINVLELTPSGVSDITSQDIAVNLGELHRMSRDSRRNSKDGDSPNLEFPVSNVKNSPQINGNFEKSPVLQIDTLTVKARPIEFFPNNVEDPKGQLDDEEQSLIGDFLDDLDEELRSKVEDDQIAARIPLFRFKVSPGNARTTLDFVQNHFDQGFEVLQQVDASKKEFITKQKKNIAAFNMFNGSLQKKLTNLNAEFKAEYDDLFYKAQMANEEIENLEDQIKQLEKTIATMDKKLQEADAQIIELEDQKSNCIDIDQIRKFALMNALPIEKEKFLANFFTQLHEILTRKPPSTFQWSDFKESWLSRRNFETFRNYLVSYKVDKMTVREQELCDGLGEDAAFKAYLIDNRGDEVIYYVKKVTSWAKLLSAILNQKKASKKLVKDVHDKKITLMTKQRIREQKQQIVVENEDFQKYSEKRIVSLGRILQVAGNIGDNTDQLIKQEHTRSHRLSQMYTAVQRRIVAVPEQIYEDDSPNKTYNLEESKILYEVVQNSADINTPSARTSNNNSNSMSGFTAELNVSQTQSSRMKKKNVLEFIKEESNRTEMH